MHTIGDFLYDSDRLILYKSDTDKEIVDIINSTLEPDPVYNRIYTNLANIDADEMKMNKIAIDNIGICLTYNCNLRCNYCGYSSTDKDKNNLQLSDVEVFISDIIEKRTIKKLITKTNNPLVINFTGGGEPTYNWDLLKDTVLLVKRKCADNNIPLYLKMTTNGVLSDIQIDFISENINELMVSYDGLSEVQNRNRKCPSIEDTSLIVEHTIKKLANRGVPLIIRSTIWQEDYSKIIAMYKHVFSIVPKDGKVIWSIYPTLFEGRAVNQMNRQEDKTYKNFLVNYLKLVDYIISQQGEEGLKKIDVPLINNELSGLFCGAHRLNSPWLLPDRSIVTCMESKDNRVIVGKVNNEEVVYYQKYSDDFLKVIQQKYSECRSCIAYRFCRGGCPVWHLRENVNRIDPLECHLQREYWQYILEAVATNKYSFGWYLEKINLPNIGESEIFRLVKKEAERE